MRRIQKFEGFIKENLDSSKDPFSITVKPTEAFERSLNEIKNADGKPSFLSSSV